MTDVLRPVFNSMRHGSFRTSLGGMNPTGASCWITDEKGNEKLVGKCHRQVWYSKTKTPRTNLPNDQTFIKFAVGHAMEENFQQNWARAGVYLDGNIKVRQDISHGDPRGELIMSGEVDALLRDYDLDEEGQIEEIHTDLGIGIEMKTNRGYFSKKEIYGFGNKIYVNGSPKIEHVMQTAIYLHMRKPLEEYYGVRIESFRIVYCQVDDGHTTWFDISLSDGYDGEIIVKDRYGIELEPDALASLEAGAPMQKISGLTMDKIKDRYYKVLDHLKDTENPPPRDFQLRYDAETFELKMERGELSKTAIGNWEKKPNMEVGDWNCRYCDWGDTCYPYGIHTNAVEDGELTPEKAMSMLGISAFGA